MNRQRVRAIAMHDLHSALTSKSVLIPMLFTGMMSLVIMPVGVAFAARSLAGQDAAQVALLLERFPAALVAVLPDIAPQGKVMYLLLVQLMAPLFLMQPVMLTSALAADSFAGERERKTLDYLLSTPVTTVELMAGKVLAAWIPAVVVAAAGSLPYIVAVNITLSPYMPGLALPNWSWILLLFWVAPGAAALALGLSVVISAKVESFQAAYQAGPMILLPFIGLMMGQFTGGVFIGISTLASIGAGLWCATALVAWFAVNVFGRTQLSLSR